MFFIQAKKRYKLILKLQIGSQDPICSFKEVFNELLIYNNKQVYISL
ncbi:hypothetical protein BSPA14S_A0032 (plasmid) [Borreliella spielmanii A14S]|uniref:Uncharacterized protein n=1 Tax=Borreliella spielmanii A14S TaxID=498742 RepID=C0RC41_9SPIR|nr:hypothetical protein BSPA14S_A0032 [Borreliella spielmanii A14S]